MPVRAVWSEVTFFGRGAPSFCAFPGGCYQFPMKDVAPALYKAALTAGAIPPTYFIRRDGQATPSTLPPFLILGEPVNCIIPSIFIGSSRKDISPDLFSVTWLPKGGAFVGIDYSKEAELFEEALTGRESPERIAYIAEILRAAAKGVMVSLPAPSSDIGNAWWSLRLNLGLCPDEPFCISILPISLLPGKDTGFLAAQPWVAIGWGEGVDEVDMPPVNYLDFANPTGLSAWAHFNRAEWSIRCAYNLPPLLCYRDFFVPLHTQTQWIGDFGQLSGEARLLTVFTARGHLCVADAYELVRAHPLAGERGANLTAFNPYLVQKDGRYIHDSEYVHRGGYLRIDGFNCSALIFLPSFDTPAFCEFLVAPVPFPVQDAQETGGQTIALEKPCHRVPILKTSVQTNPLGAVWVYDFDENFRLVRRERGTEIPISLPIYLRIFGKGLRCRATRFTPSVITVEVPEGEAYGEKAVGTYVTLACEFVGGRSFFGTGVWFEIPAVAVEAPTILTTGGGAAFPLSSFASILEVTYDVSEEGAQARVSFAPKAAMQPALPLTDVPLYAVVDTAWVTLSGRVCRFTFFGFVEAGSRREEAGFWGGRRETIEIQSVADRLKRCVGDPSFPPFDNWTVSDVFRYCFVRAGLDPDLFLHFYGNDFVFSPELLWEQPIPRELPPTVQPGGLPIAGFPFWYTPEKPRFTVRVGQSLWDFLHDIALMTGNEIIVDGWGVWVIPVAYEEPLVSALLADAGRTLDLDYTLGEVNLTARMGWLPTSYISVGKSRLGAPIIVAYEQAERYANPLAPSFVGYRLADVVTDDKLATTWLAFRRAFYSYLSAFRSIPFEVEGEVLGTPLLFLRQRVLIHSFATDFAVPAEMRYRLANPNEYVIRQLTYQFSADPRECKLRIKATPPANIPYGLILPRRTH